MKSGNNEITKTFLFSDANEYIIDLNPNITFSLENNNINNINQLTTKRINGLYFIRQESDLPNPITTGTYIICNQVTLTSKYTIVGDCSFYGFGKESELRFLDVLSTNGYSISSTNYNLSFCNLNTKFIISCGSNPYLAKSAESTVDINLISSAVKISLGDII